MSFGGQWVLPGGHLEPGEDVIKGGLRECQEEVGLPLEAVAPMKDLKMMAWESVNVDEKKGLIKRAALVLFIEV
jgi:8-oxo-dGTP pyrophosphatase MutT (NUDIX family)